MANRVVVVVDMQNGVLASPRFDRAGRCERINQLTAAADQVIFIQHVGPGLEVNSAGWAIVPELQQPANAIFVNKTACDSFWQTDLAAHRSRRSAWLSHHRRRRCAYHRRPHLCFRAAANQSDQRGIKSFVICGCATDYCVDTTIKVGASLGYHITVAADAPDTTPLRRWTFNCLVVIKKMPHNSKLISTTAHWSVGRLDCLLVIFYRRATRCWYVNHGSNHLCRNLGFTCWNAGATDFG